MINKHILKLILIGIGLIAVITALVLSALSSPEASQLKNRKKPTPRPSARVTASPSPSPSPAPSSTDAPSPVSTNGPCASERMNIQRIEVELKKMQSRVAGLEANLANAETPEARESVQQDLDQRRAQAEDLQRELDDAKAAYQRCLERAV